jgi:hypothetical protein
MLGTKYIVLLRMNVHDLTVKTLYITTLHLLTLSHVLVKEAAVCRSCEILTWEDYSQNNDLYLQRTSI